MTGLERTLAANLRTLRQRWGFSQAQLAERAEVSVGYVGDLELGRKWPRPEVLERLAQALGAPVQQLFLPEADLVLYRQWLERRDLLLDIVEELRPYLKG